MRFKDFLREAKHRKDISIELAQELIQKHCSDMDILRPFWRGSKGSYEEAYTIHGELGGRSSANTSNHYTVIMDEFLPAMDYPARSKSIICATYDNIEYAHTYGRLYAIFPYNGVKIGMTSEEDIWHTKFKIGNGRTERSIEGWNDYLDGAGIPDYSYEDLVNGIKETLEDPEDESYNLIQDIFGSEDRVEGVLRRAYSPQNLGLKLITSKDDPEGEHEVWIGGPCIALRRDVWKQISGHKDESDE